MPNNFYTDKNGNTMPDTPVASEGSDYDYKRIAMAYRLSTWSFVLFCSLLLFFAGLLISLFVLHIAKMPIASPEIQAKALLVFAVFIMLIQLSFSIYCVVCLAGAIHYGIIARILFALCIPSALCFTPYFYVYKPAGEILKEAGYEVGSFGADMRFIWGGHAVGRDD